MARSRMPPGSDYMSCVFLEMSMSDLVSKVGLGSVFLLHFFERPFREWRVLRVERSATRPLKMPGLGFLFVSERRT